MILSPWQGLGSARHTGPIQMQSLAQQGAFQALGWTPSLTRSIHAASTARSAADSTAALEAWLPMPGPKSCCDVPDWPGCQHLRKPAAALWAGLQDESSQNQRSLIPRLAATVPYQGRALLAEACILRFHTCLTVWPPCWLHAAAEREHPHLELWMGRGSRGWGGSLRWMLRRWGWMLKSSMAHERPQRL